MLEHCKSFAIPHGYSTCYYDRHENLRKDLQKIIDEKHAKALEISPFFHPFLQGENVKYFGIMDSETLKKEAEKSSYPDKAVPSTIHFVSPTGDLSIIDETFDLVVSCHVIEHIPNFVKHLNDVEKLLNKGGLYVLLIPNKLYCFDHYKPESTIFDILEAFFTKRNNTALRNRLIASEATHNDSISHWLGYHDKTYTGDDNTRSKMTREGCLYQFEIYKKAIETGQYIDEHHWRFTPNSFRDVVNSLNEMKFINLPLYRLYHTLWGRTEFIAILEKI